MRDLKQEKNNFNNRSVIGSLNLLTNSTRPDAQLSVHQCAPFSTDTKLPHDQAVKRVLKYLKGMSMQGLILKPDPEKGIKCYVDANFAGGWNQEEGKDPGSVLYRMGCIIMSEIVLRTMEAEYIDLSQVVRGVLPFVSLMEDI